MDESEEVCRKVGGYAGKVLRVNLSVFKISEEKLDLGLAKDFIGGLGIASRVMLEESHPYTEPLGPENRLIFSTGVLTGSIIPGANKSIVVSRSPLTNILGEAIFSADCGIELKQSGYDILIIEGQAEKPVYLWIYDGMTEIRDARGIWGMETFDACTAIKGDLGDKGARVVCIGPAGEKLVRLAAIVSDNGRIAGRCGLGAVMGSKRLKGIACRGSNKIEVANRGLVQSLRNETVKSVKEKLKGMSEHGTSAGVEVFEAMGNLPVKNWTRGIFPGAYKISGRMMTQTMLVGKRSCFGCPIGCGRYIKIKEGPYAVEGHGPEYETIAAFGSLCLNDNLESIAKANDICNRLGIDTISTGATIAFAMECYEKSIISKNDTDGINLTWGNHEAVVRMTELIGRREGFGVILGEGSKRAATIIGKGSGNFAMHVNGLELPMHNPYRFKEMGLQYAISERGACHLRGYAFLPSRKVLVPDLGFDKELDGFSIEGKGKLTKTMQDACCMIDALGICKFLVFFGGMPLTRLADFYTAVTGWKTELGDLLRGGEKIWMLQRAFNVKMGIRRRHDKLPTRFLKESMIDGGAKNQVVELEPMLREYYETRGLDESGKPKTQKLNELGLGFAYTQMLSQS